MSTNFSSASGPTAPASSAMGNLRSWIVVALLSFLYFMSFVDRAILALLVESLMRDFQVNEVELGLLFGPAFAIFYAVLGIPFARVADRGNRKALIIGGVLLWGLCTMASGLAGSFGILVALRIGLAIGEATLTPATYSLIGEMFVPSKRIAAAGIYSAIGIAGAAGAYLVCALVIHLVETGQLGAWIEGASTWRAAFVIVGLPAVLGALGFAFVAREPARPQDHAAGHDFRGVIEHLRAHPRLYFTLFCGAGILQAVTYGYAAWGPEVMRRSFGLPIREVGTTFGLAGLMGASLGTFLAPMVARQWQLRGRTDAIAMVATFTAIIGGLAATAGPQASSPWTFVFCYAIASFGLFGASTGLLVAMQTIAPQHMRGTLVALLLMAMTLLGGIIGPPLVAVVGTSFFSPQELGKGLSILSAMAALAGVISLACSRKPLIAYLADQPRSLL